MQSIESLPAYSDESLAALGLTEIIALMVGDEDRVPRNLIDECARRGDETLERLSRLVEDKRGSADEIARGEWWLSFHAIMIAGLIPTERAGLLLVKFMRWMAVDEDGNLQDWCAGDWPALFRNKPPAVLPLVRAVCEDRSLDWYTRANAVEPVVAAAREHDDQALDKALAWAAAMAADESDDWEFRLSVGNVLLDFPRVGHRPLLEDLAARQTGWGVHFSAEEMREAYAAGKDRPGWIRRGDPWKFYLPEAIEKRRQRWAKEDAQEPAVPAIRDEPKVGRNDPCPCGSGKKFKKCCLRAEAAAVETPAEFLRRRIRVVIDQLTDRLLRFVRDQFGSELIQEAWEDFTGESEPFDAQTPHITVFMPWFFYTWFPTRSNTGFADLAARKATVAAEWIRLQRRRPDPLLVRYLEACAAAKFSFHEAVRVEPGRGFLLRDLMLETETFVIERIASRTVRAGDVMFAQTVVIDGLTMLEGCGPLVFQPREKPEIIELRKTIRGKGDVVSETRLEERSLELIDLYLELSARALHPLMPELQNTDGEPLEPHTLVFGIGDSAVAAAALDAATIANGETIKPDGERKSSPALEAGWIWASAGNRMHKSWINTTLGQLALAGGQLKVNVNSAARAVRARALVERLLEGNAKYRVTEITSAEAMLADAGSRPARDGEGEHEKLMQIPEVRQQFSGMLMDYYRGWLDTPIPMLNGRTPRAAARNHDEREAVAALVAQIERDGAAESPPQDPAIVAMLRRELGLD
jgi:hypothetical protein